MATLTNDAHAAHPANDAQATGAATDTAGAAIRSTNGTMVMLETPYSGNVDRNLRYLMLCGFDAYARGEMPVATHAFMTTHPAALHYYVSDYAKEWDVYSREEAIARGQVLRRRCDLTVVYADLGMSTGMKAAVHYCQQHGLPYEVRHLDIDLVLSIKAPLITRELVTAILEGTDYRKLLRVADATVV
jgi:hypothetical protein